MTRIEAVNPEALYVGLADGAKENWLNLDTVRLLRGIAGTTSARDLPPPAQGRRRRHPRPSSSLYGIIDLDDPYQYRGGMALAVEQVSGQAPSLYVNDLVGGKAVHDGCEAIVLELLCHCHNPEFLKGSPHETDDKAR